MVTYLYCWHTAFLLTFKGSRSLTSFWIMTQWLSRSSRCIAVWRGVTFASFKIRWTTNWWLHNFCNISYVELHRILQSIIKFVLGSSELLIMAYFFFKAASALGDCLKCWIKSLVAPAKKRQWGNNSTLTVYVYFGTSITTKKQKFYWIFQLLKEKIKFNAFLCLHAVTSRIDYFHMNSVTCQ